MHYIEGCSAPVYTTDSLHSAVVELVALEGSRITYTTIQNWSNNVYNLVTKRARAEAEAHVEWIDGNIGSRLTMKYPSVYLMGPKASGEVLSVAYAGAGQHQDAGAKMVHAAPETTSTIVSKSISKDAGITTYRGLVHVDEGAKHAKSFVRCDALLLDDTSVSETKPYMEVGERDARIGHEATVSKVGDDQLFYLMSRGLSETQAMGMIVNGFIEPITRTLPDGVRRRVEPADRAADGGLRRLTPVACRRRARAAPQWSGRRRGSPSMPMREECKHFQSRTYDSGEVARFCVLDLAPEAPWKCPTTARPTPPGWPTSAGPTAPWSSRPSSPCPTCPATRRPRARPAPRTSSTPSPPTSWPRSAQEDEKGGRKWWRRKR